MISDFLWVKDLSILVNKIGLVLILSNSMYSRPQARETCPDFRKQQLFLKKNFNFVDF